MKTEQERYKERPAVKRSEARIRDLSRQIKSLERTIAEMKIVSTLYPHGSKSAAQLEEKISKAESRVKELSKQGVAETSELKALQNMKALDFRVTRGHRHQEEEEDYKNRINQLSDTDEEIKPLQKLIDERGPYVAGQIKQHDIDRDKLEILKLSRDRIAALASKSERAVSPSRAQKPAPDQESTTDTSSLDETTRTESVELSLPSDEQITTGTGKSSPRPRVRRLMSHAMRTAAASRRGSRITCEGGGRFRDSVTGRFVSMRTLR